MSGPAQQAATVISHLAQHPCAAWGKGCIFNQQEKQQATWPQLWFSQQHIFCHYSTGHSDISLSSLFQPSKSLPTAASHHTLSEDASTRPTSKLCLVYVSTTSSMSRPAADESSTAFLVLTPKRQVKRSQTQQKYLNRYPPGSKRWIDWIEALCSIPHITAETAGRIVCVRPQLLTFFPDEVASRLSAMSALLKKEAAITQTEFASLLLACPNTITVDVETARGTLAWFKNTFRFSMEELSHTIRRTPDLVAYSAGGLQERLQALLDQDVDAEVVRESAIKNPRTLTFSPALMLKRLEVLSREFQCSKQHILQTAAYTLQRRTERLPGRVAFLRKLGIQSISIHEVWAARSDRSFAEGKVRAHLKSTGKSLSQICSEFQHPPDMTAALTEAGVALHITTPLHCLQAERNLWRSVTASPSRAAKSFPRSWKGRKKRKVQLSLPNPQPEVWNLVHITGTHYK